MFSDSALLPQNTVKWTSWNSKGQSGLCVDLSLKIPKPLFYSAKMKLKKYVMTEWTIKVSSAFRANVKNFKLYVDGYWTT